MIKLGDKVRFVNENMQGVVTSIKGNTAGVTIEDDFEIPVLLSEIVRINDILDKPKEETKPITTKPRFVKVHHGFHLAFNPINEETVELVIHNSECGLAQCGIYQNQQLITTFNLALEQSHAIGKFLVNSISQWPEFHFVITQLEETFKTPHLLTRKIKFNQKEFHATFRYCYFLDKQAYTLRLDETIKQSDLQRLKEKDFGSSAQTASNTEKKWAKADVTSNVIDLHLPSQTTSGASLTAAQIVDEQMDMVRKALDHAYANKMKSITFIHGIGNHYLKNKILSYVLKHRNMIESTKDGDPLKYGGGATEVYLKTN